MLIDCDQVKLRGRALRVVSVVTEDSQCTVNILDSAAVTGGVCLVGKSGVRIIGVIAEVSVLPG